MDRERLLKQAKAKAAKFCSTRERAPAQVLDKLLDWELSEEEAQSILAELMNERFVDEERFCLAFCHDKFEFNRWGKNKIKQELFRFRLPEQVVQTGLDNINPNRYENVLKDLAEKKWNSIHSEKDQWVRKQKTTAYLLQKGFEMDLSIEIVSSLSDAVQ
ncbi:MAG: regulatory protein RecX [Marinoscillum sp.]